MRKPSANWEDYCPGGLDVKGREISEIYSSNDSFIIYEAEGLLRLEGETGPLDKSPAISRLLVEVLSLRPSSPEARRDIFCQISMALEICIAGDSKAAEEILESIQVRATGLRSIRGRLMYLWGCISLSLLVNFFGALFLLFSKSRVEYLEWAVLVAMLGSAGGVMSVAMRINGLAVDSDAGVFFNLSWGGARCIIAVIGALFFCFAVQGGLLFSMIGDKLDKSALSALAILAGFSETLVPRLTRHVADESDIA